MNKALLFFCWPPPLPAHAAMDITRELEAPAQIVPGQPVRVAITGGPIAGLTRRRSGPSLPSKKRRTSEYRVAFTAGDAQEERDRLERHSP